jgi:hypothetical protein
MYKQQPGDPLKKLDSPTTFREDSPMMKLAKDGSNPMFKYDSSPMNKNGKDKKKDDFNYKSDMGKYNPTVTSYEGDAFVGKRGGKAQKEGAKVSGVTEGTRGGDNKSFRGKVTGPAKSSKSEQSRRVKGATYSS